MNATQTPAYLLRAPEAAAYLGVSLSTFLRIVRIYHVPRVKFGPGPAHSVGYRKADLQALADRLAAPE